MYEKNEGREADKKLIWESAHCITHIEAQRRGRRKGANGMHIRIEAAPVSERRNCTLYTSCGGDGGEVAQRRGRRNGANGIFDQTLEAALVSERRNCIPYPSCGGDGGGVAHRVTYTTTRMVPCALRSSLDDKLRQQIRDSRRRIREKQRQRNEANITKKNTHYVCKCL